MKEENEGKTDFEESQNESENSESELENIKKELENYKDKFIRVVAEYDNYRKRTEKEKVSIYSCVVCDTVSKILPVIDSLELASKNLKESKNVNSEYQKGLDLVNNQALDCLNKLKVESFGKIGEEFNPDIHNAVSHVNNEKNKKNNIITEVFQKGYKLENKIIRHAMVQVTN
ncbi:MAG: nucleotide exchange factor GrpE [Candidatus Paraimprobicoccus trichonymphae]|uniref:Protein GrpE n=1 Tax=Candidatus Paraimprobicoccus trichonymphae TaxID=3033793 RepID=A0AA48I2W0_9FIRM|nr:MAG: nucleotide exchange factor GrpE [Candidatus Paraimprobicoccus trichonymphae]